jgi:hypothetical protein
MADVLMLKTPAGALAPMDEAAREFLSKFKSGQPVRATVKRARNVLFHRKVFSLFKLAFDTWEPEAQEYKGEAVEKDFDRFRRDLTILAGFYKATYNIRGEVRLEAESLSFASMDDERFEQVFKAVLNVVWKKVLKDHGYRNPDDVERVIEELLRYD